MRWVYIGAGLLALSSSCYMAVMASGGLSSQSAPGLIAMAVVLAVGAASIGHALAGGHTGIAIVIGLGMLAGEGGAMLQTAQRVTAAREAMRVPIAAIAVKRQSAIDDLAKAEAAKPTPVDHTRVDAAELAKSEAEKAVRDKSAEPGCRQNCRLLLQSAVDAAQREVEAARADLARQDADESAAVTKRLETARSVVGALPPPQSATPLADYTGVPEWIYDVVEALTLSFAINLPASALVALGVKMGLPRRQTNKVPVHETATEKTTPQAEAQGASVDFGPSGRNPATEADRFGLARLRPDPDARLTPGDLRSGYIEWCEQRGVDPLPIQEIAPALGKMFRKAGIAIVDGAAVGVTIERPSR
jgi:hypothetical protein